MENIHKNKICFITHLPNLTGANQSLLDLIDGLDINKYKPIVFLGKDGPLIEELKKRNIEYYIMGYSTAIREKNPFINLVKDIKSKIAVYKMSRFFIKERIDIVHNNSLLVWAGMEAAKRSGTKYVCHVRELVWQDHHIRLLREKEQYKLMENANMTIFISEFVQNNYIKQYNVERYVTIKDGFHTARYLNKNHNPLFEKSPVKIVIAGRIVSGKGQMDAVKAVGNLNLNGRCSCELLVVGSVCEQDYADKMKRYVADKHLENCITFRSFSDLKEIRAESDIELVCSEAEGLGRVTVESMLSGCLTIGADAGATPEIIIDGKNGYLYKSGDFIDLSNKIVFAIENKKQVKKIQEDAINYCLKNFDLKHYVDLIEMEYVKICTNEEYEYEILYK